MADILGNCFSCGAALDDEEAYFYGHRCENCEREWHWRVEAWRHGAEDEELDSLYGEP